MQVYAPFAQLPVWFERRRPSMALLTKTAIAPETVITSIRQKLSNIDPDVPLYNVQTLDTYVSQHTEQSRLNVILLGGLGGLALLLAAIGIYGVVSYSVAQRTPEIGVRVALGATSRDVMRLVVGHAAALVILGVVIGLIGAMALGSVLRALVFQVSERDVTTFVVVATGLTFVGIIASVVPALRATRVDPLEAMRDA